MRVLITKESVTGVSNTVHCSLSDDVHYVVVFLECDSGYRLYSYYGDLLFRVLSLLLLLSSREGV